MSRAGRNRERGPVFVEIAGHLHLNLAFDLEPLDEEIRERVAATCNVEAGDLVVLRKLSSAEQRLVVRRRMDADTEAWARIMG